MIPEMGKDRYLHWLEGFVVTYTFIAVAFAIQSYAEAPPTSNANIAFIAFVIAIMMLAVRLNDASSE